MKKSAEIVFISNPSVGNLVPAIEFATHLTNSDPRLSATILVITSSHRPLVTSYTESRAAAATTGKVRFVHLPTVDPPSPNQYQASIGYLSLLIENYKPHVKDAITSLMQTQPESTNSVVPLAGLFIDMFCTSMIDIANEVGVPCYLYFASPASFLGFMLHLPTLVDQPTEFDDSLTELTIPGFSNPVPMPVFPTFFLTRNDDDACFWFNSHACRYKETKGIIVNTFKELEPYALDSLSSAFPDLPPVYPVGPVVDHHGPARWQSDRSHENITKWLDQQPPSSVVFLCFGSMGGLSPSQVKEIALGLERTGQRFLWSLREPARSKVDLPSNYTDPKEVLPDGFVDRTAEKGLICGWVPQVTILAHKAIGGFVSHCGWNSILESLWYGVPIATWPIYAEQQMNAFEMVRDLKLGVELRLDYRVEGIGSNLVTAEEVDRGVRTLMGSDGGLVREKVKEMREKSHRAVVENGSSFVTLGHLIQELLAQK